ncbi:MAG: NUDIX domain-containing protein [Micromonosporaceae bacterium]|nr:NUDIX domain-containing protein [Micromonosporaceae bacterium]
MDMAEQTAQLVARGLRFAESGAEPAPARLAATVLLLRQSGPGLEVYLLRRAASMAFASGMYAFPGGSVDRVDYSGAPLGAADRPGVDWPARLGQPEPASAVVRAALRETAEETGVRLAVADLVPWTRWITPVFEPRRYDTYFFLAALPAGQQPADVSGEADRTEWASPADAVARTEAGEIFMFRPTSVTLGELVGFDTVGAALAAGAGRDAATAVLPRVEQSADGTARFVIGG